VRSTSGSSTLERLVARVIEAGGHASYGDAVTILATTALRISEVSGLSEPIETFVPLVREVFSQEPCWS